MRELIAGILSAVLGAVERDEQITAVFLGELGNRVKGDPERHRLGLHGERGWDDLTQHLWSLFSLTTLCQL